MGSESIDIVWIVLSAGLVLVMQAGFLCLESGLTRNKNNVNVAVKNLSDFSVSTVLYWLFGFGLMFGASQAGVVGASLFVPDYGADMSFGFLLFQIMFCGTAVTILSGAIAERVRFTSYLIIAALISGLIYPVFGHWVWNGIPDAETSGFLGDLGFVDFAGSSVVHSVGGWAALAILLIIGPRTGRFNDDGSVNRITGGNLPLAALGIIFLWFGWFGFNGGSTLAASGGAEEIIVRVLVNTVVAGAFGTCAALMVGWPLYGKAEVHLVLNGALVGLVSVTANAHAVSLPAAAVIGAIGGVVMVGLNELMIRNRIDDAVGAIPVHLGGGIWGTLAVGIFGQSALLGTDLTRFEQVGVQALGVGVAGAWAFGVTYGLLWLLNRYMPLRVTPEDEHIGLNVSEHGAANELQDLFATLQAQQETGDLGLRAPVEPFTEVGQIAIRYNAVMEALQTAVARTDTIVRSAMDAIVTFDIDPGQERFTIQSLNPAAETVFGYGAPQLVGHPVSRLLATEDEREVQRMLVAATLNESHVEIEGRRADGTAFPMEVALAEADTRNSRFITGIFRDITERKRYEEELQTAKADAEAANRSKSTFLANMSHELRTPLNAVIGYGDMILSGLYGPLTDKQSDRMERIVQNGHLLLGHINSILDLSKIEAERMDLYIETFSLDALLTNVSSTVSPLALKNHNTIARDWESPLGDMHSDVTKIQQILLNLLSSACKFTENGTVTLTCQRETGPDGEVVLFQVIDTGIGMDADQLAKVFDEFTQADVSTTRRYGGTGLGLALVSRFVEMLGGSIDAASTVGEGSTFTLRLPADISAQQPDAMRPDVDSQPVALNRDLVLVVDDDAAVREMLEHYLTQEGFNVATAATGNEGLQKARELRPGLITLDVMIPEIDGWSVLAQLKSDPYIHHIPVIMLTILDDRNVGFTLGATDFVSKPIQREQLARAVSPFKPQDGAGLILVVEDDDSTRRMIVDMLEDNSDWQIVEAENGAIGLEKLRRYAPDLVLLDLMMPVMDGFNFIEKKRDLSDETPVIVITSMDLDRDARARLNGGIQNILQKGNYTREELMDEVRRQLRLMSNEE